MEEDTLKQLNRHYKRLFHQWDEAIGTDEEWQKWNAERDAIFREWGKVLARMLYCASS